MLFRLYAFVASVLASMVCIAVSACDPAPLGPALHRSIQDQEDVTIGRGLEAKQGSLVTVRYRVALPDGTAVVDLYDQGSSHTFALGDGTVIPGLDLIVTGMNEGGVRQGVIPWALGYGSLQYGEIPPRTSLHVRVDLLDVRGASVARSPAR